MTGRLNHLRNESMQNMARAVQSAGQPINREGQSGRLTLPFPKTIRSVAGSLSICLISCASTSSVILPLTSAVTAVAVLPLDGLLGEQAADFLSQELVANGIPTVERVKTLPKILVDKDLQP